MGRATVAYTDPQGVLSKNEALFEKSLAHLVSLNWQPAPLDDPLLGVLDISLRTIPALDVVFEPEVNSKPAYHQVPGLVLLPLLQILVLEVTSVEIYRSKLRQLGKEWFTRHVDIREPTGYAVVLVRKPEDSEKSVKSIWTRMIAEFDESNCVQLELGNQVSWIQLRQLVQQQLLLAFDQRVVQLCSEARKLHATRNVPGWNFGALFAVYDSLACAFESVNLFDDALHVYTSLHTMVSTVESSYWSTESKTANEGFFEDRNVLIDLMVGQKASKFDALKYIVSREITLLVNSSVVRMKLKESSVSLANKNLEESISLALTNLPSLVESLNSSSKFKQEALQWTLTAARELYTLIEQVGGSALGRGKGNILLVERDALQSLACLRGWTIPGIFNDVQLDEIPLETKDENETKDETKDKDENKDKNGIDTEEEFRAKFCALTEQCIALFSEAGLNRAVTRLKEQLAVMYYHQNDIEKAWEIIQSSNLCGIGTTEPSLRLHCLPVVGQILEIALHCAEKLDLESTMLELSYTILSLESKRDLVNKAETYLKKFANLVHSKHSLSLWYKPEIARFVKADENGYFIELKLHSANRTASYLDLVFDSVELEAEFMDQYTGVQELITFKAGEVNASSPIKLYADKFFQDVIQMKSCIAKIGNQEFNAQFENVNLVMKPLANAFTADLKLSKHSSIQKRSIEVELRSPIEIKNAEISLTVCEPVGIQLTESHFTLTNFKKTVVQTSILGQTTSQQLAVECKYDNGKTYKFWTVLDLNLAVSVDFQEHFRQPPAVYLQFLVQPFNNQAVVFLDCNVTDSKHGLVCRDFAPSHRNKEMLAYRDAPVSYLFKLLQQENLDAQTEESTLVLKYRRIVDECHFVLFTEFMARANEVIKVYELSINEIAKELSYYIDMSAYIVDNLVLISESTVDEIVNNSVIGLDSAAKIGVHELVNTALKTKTYQKVISEFKTNDEWKQAVNCTIELGIPNPEADFVHYISLELINPEPRYVVGEAISAVLHIQTVELVSTEYKFCYELDRLSEGWSYTGRSRGIFTSNSVEEKITLIPNRSGELLLPNVVIRRLHSAPTATPIVVAEHTNVKVLVVPEVNMLAITF